MLNDGFGDWRIQAVTTLASDVPSAYPGGPSHKKGTAVYLVTEARDTDGTPISFTTPSPAALALAIALEASREASKLRDTIAFRSVITPKGPGRDVVRENLPHLYNYFQQCMVAVTFSFQALEVFCNETIAQKVTGIYKLVRKKGETDVDADELQRLASTDQKVGDILPKLLGRASPRGSKSWQSFQRLKATRDCTIHLKKKEAYPRDMKPSLFHQFLQEGVAHCPKEALEIIEYFILPAATPRWLGLVREEIYKQ